MDENRTHSTYAEKTTLWAHLGYAIMKCQMLEHRLADVLFMCEMLDGVYNWSDQNACVPEYQKKTLGWLRRRIRAIVTLPPSLDNKLSEVLKIRNELAHS